MKARAIVLRDRIDALAVRERVAVFCGIAGLIAYVGFALVLEPMFARRAALQTEMAQGRVMIDAIDLQIAAAVQAHALDPDLANLARLRAIDSEVRQLGTEMQTVQSGMVAPEQMAPLLETMLKQNGKLRLLGMNTLAARPVSDSIDEAPAQPAEGQTAQMLRAVTAAAAPAAPATPGAAAPVPIGPLLYRHGVELTVRGNYLDMVRYLEALEAMPTQLIWGKADLVVEEYPTARLTLTMYTLSLDKKWMKL